MRGVVGVRRGFDRRWVERGQRPLRAHLGLLREAVPRDLFQCRHHGRLLQQRFSAGLEDRNLMECLCKVQLDRPADTFEVRLLATRMVRVEKQRVDQEGDEPVRAQEQLLVDVLVTGAACEFRQKETLDAANVRKCRGCGWEARNLRPLD